MTANRDEDIWAALAQTGPQAAQLVKQLQLRHRRGRKDIDPRNYRRLELWWKAFRRAHRSVPEAQAVQQFFRKHGAQIEGELGIKRGRRGTQDGQMRSLLNAVAKGADESLRLYRRRFAPWLVYDLLGRHHLERDRNVAAYIRAAQEYALLGTGPFRPL